MTKRKEMTLSEILGHPAATGPSLEEIQANYPQIVAEVERASGPQVPARLPGPGRPAKGTRTVPTTTHCLRVADPIWESLSQKAHAAGISLNQAAQQALLEWVNH
jgi:hypothetical protein